MSFPKPTTEYWNRKLQSYLHDPFDKVFKIPNHEARASELLEILGEQADSVQFWKEADILASGIERGTIPGYKEDDLKSGAIDFLRYPIITHPTGTDSTLEFNLDIKSDQEIINELKIGLKKFIGMKAGGGGYSDKFKNEYEKFTIARFFYLHLVLRFKLAEDKKSLLGQLWHRIPADSRFPDHSIWNHNQLVSALNSCMDYKIENTGTEYVRERRENIGLSVFSISPVQGFIGKSRKLRDYWTSSIILSYLTFEGIKWVMENLGPDHILYPSLIDQPLISEYLNKYWRLKKADKPEIWEKHSKDIATFPNKFLFLIPINKREEIVTSIKQHINSEWLKITEFVKEYTVKEKELDENDYFSSIWKRQNENFWEYSSATVKLADLNDEEELKKLFDLNNSEEIKTAKIFKEMGLYNNSKAPLLYGFSHSLVQSVLASEKSSKTIKRLPEPGEKCQLCGEFEVLHTVDHSDKSANEYGRHLKEVWKKINKEVDEVDFKENERLCSVCLTKRLLSKVIINKEHLLKSVFEKSDSFKSTTEIAIQDSKAEGDKKRIAQRLYKGEEVEGITDKDKYYAILMMDGDKMGDLINGKTIGANWNSIIHPKLKEKLKGDNKFPDGVRAGWEKLLDKKNKEYIKIRNMIPSVHASISESLGDFAIYGVAPIIEKYKGRLIYAGGDDVAAIMPLKNVLKTAKDVRDYYIQSFRSIGIDGKTNKDTGINRAGKLSVGLGNSEGISISAGILICHHKEPLSAMIQRVHKLLDKVAKEEAGRNAFAIELKKRSGGSRYFSSKWDGNNIFKNFIEFGKYAKNEDLISVSTSLIYRLEKFRAGIEAILHNEHWGKLLKKFLIKQLDRSDNTKEIKNDKMAEIIGNICIYIDKNGKRIFEPERLIVAAFLNEEENND